MTCELLSLDKVIWKESMDGCYGTPVRLFLLHNLGGLIVFV